MQALIMGSLKNGFDMAGRTNVDIVLISCLGQIKSKDGFVG